MDVTQFYTPQEAKPQSNGANGTNGFANNTAQGAENSKDVFQALFYSFMAPEDTETLATATTVNDESSLSSEDMDLLKTVLESALPGSNIPSQEALQMLSQNLSEEGLDHLEMLSGMPLLQTPVTDTIPDLESVDISGLFGLNGENITDQDGLLERLAAQLEAMQEQGEAANLLPNLTPEQMTNLQNTLIEASQTGEIPEDLEGLEAVIAALVPLQTNNTEQEVIADTSEDAVIAQILGNAKQQKTSSTEQQVSPLTQEADTGLMDDLLDIQTSTDKFRALMKNAAAKAQAGVDSSTSQVTQTQDGTTASTAELKAAAAAQNGETASTAPTPLPSGALAGLPFSEGSLTSALGLTSETLSTLGFHQGGIQSSGTSTLTNISMQSSHAAQGHPGTNMVAATLTRGVKAGGEVQTMTLQLDPADLGRIEVRMEFGKDRTLKAKIISEKPEAHMMLQRDAQSLEKALQDSGLEADASSLEFTLADDGHNFNQDGRHDGSRNAAMAGDSSESGEGEEDVVLIETTMSWDIDPRTGYMHYNILV